MLLRITVLLHHRFTALLEDCIVFVHQMRITPQWAHLHVVGVFLYQGHGSLVAVLLLGTESFQLPTVARVAQGRTEGGLVRGLGGRREDSL